MALPDSPPLDLDTYEPVRRTEPRGVFGGYLLFKRLERDALGDVYRGGRLGGDGVTQVVSLRLFNGGEVQGGRFWQVCRERLPLSTTLRGRTFGPVVETGCEDGVPFVAQEYVFGRTLAELLERVRESSNPVPLDYALHLMDRIAHGLCNAYETRLEGERVIHGFLTPEFVHVASEGEVRLSGFESSGGLLDLAIDGPARSARAGYLSPEVNAGEPAQASDDVYTLGAIFLELLTGEQLPPLGSDGIRRWVEAAELSSEATPLPENVRELLSESLLPREQRLQNAERWREALAAVITTADCQATAFSIAYFMNTLFGEELDREVLLVEAEKHAEELASAGESPLEPEPALLPTSPAQAGSHSASDAGSGRHRIAIAAAAVLLGGLAVAYLVLDLPIPGVGSAKAKPVSVTAVAVPRPSYSSADLLADPVEAAVDESGLKNVAVPGESSGEIGGESSGEIGGDSSGEIGGQPAPYPDEVELLRSLVDRRAGEMETTLRAKYDEQLVQLQTQLEQARQAEAERSAAAERSVEPAPPAETSDRLGEAAPQMPTESPSEPTLTAGSESHRPAAMTEVLDEARTPSTPEAAVEIAEPAQSEREPAMTIAAPEPVQPGSIVTNGPGVTPPGLIRQPTVTYPPAARRLNRQATVRVRVLVDETGKVSRVEQVTEKIGLGFDQAALQAARTTRWTPPEKDGVQVKMWVGLSLDFRP